jgi:hypothetical protein
MRGLTFAVEVRFVLVFGEVGTAFDGDAPF